MAIGDIWYSERANRYYQEGRSGAVGRDFAVRSLLWDEERQVYMDSRGRTISPNLLAAESRTAWRWSAQDLHGRTFVTGEARSELISQAELKTIKLASNQDIVGRIVVHTSDGKTHVFPRSFGTGKNIDPQQAIDTMTGHARGILKNSVDKFGNPYEIDSPTVRNQTTRIDFYKRTLKVR